jgi:hypothetical protein
MPHRLTRIAHAPWRLFDRERRFLKRIPLPRFFHTDISSGFGVVLVVAIVVFAGASLGPRRMCACHAGPSKSEIAQRLVNDMAAVGTMHDGSCPTTVEIDDLPLHTTDPWGHAIRVTCSVAGVNVTSAGPDGQLDTPDDITCERR